MTRWTEAWMPLACGNQAGCDGIRPNRRSSSLRSAGYAWIRPRAVSVAGRSASVSSAVSAVGSWSPFLHSIKASIMSSTPLSRSGRPGVRIESVRALTAQTMLRARAGSRRSCRTRCCGSGAWRPCYRSPAGRCRDRGDEQAVNGSADPGLGMNRAPDRLYLAVLVVLCSCRLRARGERRCVLPFRIWRSSARNRPAR